MSQAVVLQQRDLDSGQHLEDDIILLEKMMANPETWPVQDVYWKTEFCSSPGRWVVPGALLGGGRQSPEQQRRFSQRMGLAPEPSGHFYKDACIH